MVDRVSADAHARTRHRRDVGVVHHQVTRGAAAEGPHHPLGAGQALRHVQVFDFRCEGGHGTHAGGGVRELDRRHPGHADVQATAGRMPHGLCNQVVEHHAAVEQAAGHVEGGGEAVTLQQRQGQVVVVPVAVVEGQAHRPSRQPPLLQHLHRLVQWQDLEPAAECRELALQHLRGVDLVLQGVERLQHAVVHQDRQRGGRTSQEAPGGDGQQTPPAHRLDPIHITAALPCNLYNRQVRRVGRQAPPLAVHGPLDAGAVLSRIGVRPRAARNLEPARPHHQRRTAPSGEPGTGARGRRPGSGGFH